jgi:hypothetical protein
VEEEEEGEGEEREHGLRWLVGWGGWKVGPGLCGLNRGVKGGYIDGFPCMGERGGVLRE